MTLGVTRVLLSLTHGLSVPGSACNHLAALPKGDATGREAGNLVTAVAHRLQAAVTWLCICLCLARSSHLSYQPHMHTVNLLYHAAYL